MQTKTKQNAESAPAQAGRHTPGPWQYAGSLNGPDIAVHQAIADATKEVIAINGGAGFIARVSTGRKSGLEAIGTEYEANARLIASALALVEALETLLACAWPNEDAPNGRTNQAMANARAALALAKGGDW